MRNSFLVFSLVTESQFSCTSNFSTNGCNGWPHGKIPNLIASVDRYHVQRDSWYDFISFKLVFKSLFILLQQSKNVKIFEQSYKLFCFLRLILSIDFCQLTKSPQVILLRMITHSIFNQHHAQYKYTNYIAITLLNYHWTCRLDDIRLCEVVIYNQTSNEQQQLEPSK